MRVVPDTCFLRHASIRRVHKTGFAHAGKTILFMLLIGIVCIFIAAHLYSLVVRIGLSTSTAVRLPSYGFFAGIALGLAVRMVRSVRDIFQLFSRWRYWGQVHLNLSPGR
jgi:hypothetical protein